jgi:hypothetical protein
MRLLLSYAKYTHALLTTKDTKVTQTTIAVIQFAPVAVRLAATGGPATQADQANGFSRAL